MELQLNNEIQVIHVSDRRFEEIFLGKFGRNKYIVITTLHLSQLRLDDPLDAVAVHGGAGMVGVLCAPIFAYQKGIFWTSKAWKILGKITNALQ